MVRKRARFRNVGPPYLPKIGIEEGIGHFVECYGFCYRVEAGAHPANKQPTMTVLFRNDRNDRVATQPKGDKVQRMEAQSARIEAGQVFLPKDAPWLGDLLNELLAFPKGKYDDQVDSVSQFLNWMSARENRLEIICAPVLVVADSYANI